jgi:hypothetical protein
MNMGTAKLVDKLEKYFDLSGKQQRKKHDKYLKVIHKLEKKKFKLEQKAQREKVIDSTSRRYQDLMRELLVISRLISKAKQQDLDD